MDGTQVFKFIWRLEKISQFLQLLIEPAHSPVFAADVPKQSYWRLKLCPYRKNSRENISCYLEYHKSNTCPQVRVDFELCIVDADKQDFVTRFFEGKVFTPGLRHGATRFASSARLLSHAPLLSPDGHLTIECRMTVFLVTNDDGDLNRLSRVFLGLFWTSMHSDVSLKTKSGPKFRVHRELIRARARKFHRVHGLGDKEIGSTVKIPGTPPDVLQAFLMYLYSGVIRSTDPKVWYRLYEMSERYEVFHLRREIVPTPTQIAVSTRRLYTTWSIDFPIDNFMGVSRVTMGRLLELDFARVGVEYFVTAKPPKICIELYVTLSDPASAKPIICSVSAQDYLKGELHFTTRQELLCNEPNSKHVLVTDIPKEYLHGDKFLKGGALRLRIAFSVLNRKEPVKTQSYQSSEASCIGLTPPSLQTLQALSLDLGTLVESSPLPTNNPNTMRDEYSSIQKAIFSAWSWTFRGLFGPKKDLDQEYTTPINMETLNLLYKYMCTGNIPIPITNTTFDLYPVAKVYELPSLRELILKKMKSQLFSDNVVAFLNFARANSVEEVVDFVKNYIRKHYTMVSIQNSWENFCLMNPTLVENLLRDIIANQVNVD